MGRVVAPVGETWKFEALEKSDAWDTPGWFLASPLRRSLASTQTRDRCFWLWLQPLNWASRNLPFRDLNRLAVRVLQPTDHRYRQGNSGDIKRSVAHKVVTAQLK